MRIRPLLLILLAVFVATPAVAQTGRGIRPESDASAVLVARDIGGQRWSIRLDLDGDAIGRCTGVVTDPNNPNADPVFLQCELVDATGNLDDVDQTTFVFECTVGPKCPSRVAGSCPGWENIGTANVPASFFLPPR